jgi:dTDP-4-dehydrorhamnose 3,5-epimerase
MYNKIKIIELKRKKNIKGQIIKIIDKNKNYFSGFGELYSSEIKKNRIKGWKKHNIMKMVIFVYKGKIKFNLIDKKKNYKITLDERMNKCIVIPPKIWFAFKGLKNINKLMNFSNIVHDKNEIETKNLKEFIFK